MTTPYGNPGPPSLQKPGPGQLPPPGWYPGPAGGPQWWDGRGWGPTAPPQNDNSTTFGVFAYVGTFIGGFLVPLIIRLTEGTKNRFVKHHSTEALNFAITQGIVTLVLMVVYFVAFFVGIFGTAGAASTQNDAVFGAGFGAFLLVVVIVIALLFAISIASIVFTVIGAVKAGQRKYWRYPVCIRFVKGAASKAEVEALNRGIV